MSFKQTAKQVFNTGRFPVSTDAAKSDQEVTHQESEIYEDGEIFPSQDGLLANEVGRKPIYATGPSEPFNRGRGPGRGHGPETK